MDTRFAPLFAGAADAQKGFETLIKSTLSAAHEEYVSRVQAGENGDEVMTELLSESLARVREALQ